MLTNADYSGADRECNRMLKEMRALVVYYSRTGNTSGTTCEGRPSGRSTGTKVCLKEWENN